MAEDAESVIIPLLGEMRSEMQELFTEMREQFAAIKQRLDKLEGGQKTIFQALKADSITSKFVTGDLEERIFELERKVELLAMGK